MSQEDTGSTPVTLVIVYGAASSQSSVRLRVTRIRARRIMETRYNAGVTRVVCSGDDLNGNPYSVEVGERALAVYVEE